MTWTIHQILLSLHIFLAIVWVGGILFVGWGVFPATRIMVPSVQRLFLKSLMHRTHWLFTFAGTGVIITGIVLGTALGPIHHWDTIWNTTYGMVWFTALIIALITLAWGTLIGYRQSMKVFANDTIWDSAEAGDPKPLNKALLITAATESVEVIGFVALIVCMISLG